MADNDRTREFAKLTETAANTAMGKLLRSFWQPVAVSGGLAPKSAKAIRILSEDLTLYRGESGKVYLVGSHCLHRRTMLHTGWIEGDEIRCMYHGWKYNGAGHCVERPAERTALPANKKIAGYPTKEYAGLIFAYMGPSEAPSFDLPRKDAFERATDLGFARAEFWPCNWFQHVENSLDPVHVSFAHMAGRVGEFGRAITESIPGPLLRGNQFRNPADRQAFRQQCPCQQLDFPELQLRPRSRTHRRRPVDRDRQLDGAGRRRVDGAVLGAPSAHDDARERCAHNPLFR